MYTHLKCEYFAQRETKRKEKVGRRAAVSGLVFIDKPNQRPLTPV